MKLKSRITAAAILVGMAMGSPRGQETAKNPAKDILADGDIKIGPKPIAVAGIFRVEAVGDLPYIGNAVAVGVFGDWPALDGAKTADLSGITNEFTFLPREVSSSIRRVSTEDVIDIAAAPAGGVGAEAFRPGKRR